MEVFRIILLCLLVVCAAAASFSKKILTSIVIFMSYSLIMSIIWVLLQSPDLAITEAAVGAGVTSILFFVTLKKIHLIDVGSAADSAKKEDGDSHEKPEK